MKSLKIKITHKGEDYAGIEIGKVYHEVSLSEAKLIQTLMKSIKEIVENSNY